MRDKVEDALGGVGFILYLAVIAAVLYGISLAFPIVREYLEAKMGYSSPAKAPADPGAGPNELAPKSP